jgi:hypothetical protein
VFLVFLLCLYIFKPSGLSSQCAEPGLNGSRAADGLIQQLPTDASIPGDVSSPGNAKTNPAGNLNDVLNRTVGFQEVFVVTLPQRTDRLDAFSVQAGLSDISFEVAHGVDGKKVLDKVLPLGMDRTVYGDGAVGCWRAHLNIYQKMVEHNIQSALVFEDDADWDVALKYQMLDVARGTRWLHNSTGIESNSPYGDQWDLLWIGHKSLEGFELPLHPRRWVTPNDPTVIPPGARHEWIKQNMTFWDDDHQRGALYTRVLYRPRWGSVTTAYAISLRGALKMMYHQSMLPFQNSLDNGIGDMCRDSEQNSNFTCIGTFPRLVAPAVVPGRGDKATDIDGHAGAAPEETTQTETKSDHLMYSVKMNIDGLMRGDSVFEARYGGEVGPKQMHLHDIRNIRGHGEILVEQEPGVWSSEVVDEGSHE